MNIICLVLVWQNAADWTQQHLIKASAGLNRVNHVGHLQTAYQKYYHQPVHQLLILQNTSLRKTKIDKNIITIKYIWFVLIETNLDFFQKNTICESLDDYHNHLYKNNFSPKNNELLLKITQTQNTKNIF